MIKLETIYINKIEDYNLLSEKISTEYFHPKILNELINRIGLRINRIEVEYPYYDSDYLSTYYLFYSKKQRLFDKKGYRLHFHRNDIYLGYITLRPTVSYTKVGKSYIHPSIVLKESAYILTSRFDVNVLGIQFDVESYPWMYQETDISICSHVAIWNVARYFGNKSKHYNCVTMGNITNRINSHLGRKIPSEGLNLVQVSDVMTQLGFSPLIIEREKGKEEEFLEEVFAYIESGIPCLGFLQQHHAISLVGHGELREDLNNLSGRVSSYNLIESLITVDDNYFPFLPVYKNSIAKNSFIKYSLSDLDFVLVPLYDRILYGYKSVRNTVRLIIDSRSYNFGDNLIVRTYLASANVLKTDVLNNNSINLTLKKRILELEMPKYVWCVDLSTYDEYKNGKMSGRIIIDSTCCSREPLPMLLIHDDKKIVFSNEKMWYNNNVSIVAYGIYRNNLRRIEL